MKILRHMLMLVVMLGLTVFGAAQKDFTCHTNHSDRLYGLYCSTINASFVGLKHGGLQTTTVINGVITPITGTLTFGVETVILADDYDSNDNPICYTYDTVGNITGTKACVSVPDYSILKWDIVIGAVHLVFDPTFAYITGPGPTPPHTNNSRCGDGYSHSEKMNNGDTMYYICGDNEGADNMGTLVLVFPTEFLTNNPRYGTVNLSPEDAVTGSDGSVTFWDSGLYNGYTHTTPNASTLGALDPPSTDHGKK
jgi:hypothetical protein